MWQEELLHIVDGISHLQPLATATILLQPVFSEVVDKFVVNFDFSLTRIFINIGRFKCLRDIKKHFKCKTHALSCEKRGIDPASMKITKDNIDYHMLTLQKLAIDANWYREYTYENGITFIQWNDMSMLVLVSKWSHYVYVYVCSWRFNKIMSSLTRTLKGTFLHYKLFLFIVTVPGSIDLDRNYF